MENGEINGGDKLILRGMEFQGFHGVRPEERTLGQKFRVDIDAWMDLRPAGISDHISDSSDYTDIYRIVKDIVEGTPQNLVESVAEKIASSTLNNHSRMTAIRVKVWKPHVPIHGTLDYLGIEIFRRRTSHRYLLPTSL